MNRSPDQIAHRSREIHQQGFCCSESVLKAIAEGRGIQSDLIPALATGFCGGVSRTGGICGAVSGGVMGISMILGRRSADQSREENFRVVREFLTKFEEQFGSTNCQQLIGCRLDTPEGQRFFRENNLREKCDRFTGEAARLAAALLPPRT